MEDSPPTSIKRHEGMEDPTPAQIGIGAEPPGFAPFFLPFYIIFDVLMHKPKEGWSFLGNINIYF